VRILYHHRTRSKDGQYVHIEEMIHALRAQGHEVIIVAPPSAETESFGSDAGAVALLKRWLPKWFYELMELGYSLVAYRRLAKAIREHKPDCIYERYNLFLPAGIWAARRYKLPLLLEVNAPILEERSRYDGLSLTRLARWSQAYAWRKADMVLPVTQVLGDIVASYGVDPKRIVVIPNGINGERFERAPDVEAAKRALGLDGRLVLGFTGFVRDWHGLDKVLDLIAADPPGSAATCWWSATVRRGRPGAPGARARHREPRDLHRHRRARRRGPPRGRVRHRPAAGGGGVCLAAQVVRIPGAGQGHRRPGPAEYRRNPAPGPQCGAVRSALAHAIQVLCTDDALRARVAENARATIGARQLTWDANARRVVGLFDALLQDSPAAHSERRAA
jgi:glycosyltransferase involved in cell wall biosynthesis